MVGEMEMTQRELSVSPGYFDTMYMSKRIRKEDTLKDKTDCHPLNVIYGPEMTVSIRSTEGIVSADQIARLQEVLDNAAVKINKIMGW